MRKIWEANKRTYSSIMCWSPAYYDAQKCPCSSLKSWHGTLPAIFSSQGAKLYGSSVSVTHPLGQWCQTDPVKGHVAAGFHSNQARTHLIQTSILGGINAKLNHIVVKYKGHHDNLAIKLYNYTSISLSRTSITFLSLCLTLLSSAKVQLCLM